MNKMQLKHRVDSFAKVVDATISTDSMNNNIELEEAIFRGMAALRKLRSEKGILYIVGNGGSAAVASHALVDFVNVAKINAHVLHESSLLTCMANDFGYENAYARVLSQIMQPKDILIAISSSGQSNNICGAAKLAKQIGSKVMTFSGFKSNNALRNIGDINFWLDSEDYGFVEVGHQFILHNLVDRFGVENKLYVDGNIEQHTVEA